MRRLFTRALAMAAATGATAGAAHAATVTRIDAAPAREGWFVCDAVTGPYAAFVGTPDAAHRSLITLLDRRTGHLDTQAYQVGPGDPGAGNIYWPLSQGGRQVGTIHGINPGMVDGSQDWPPMRQVTIGPTTLDCRWVAGMAFLGLDSRRSVMVTREAGGFVYRTFDYARRGPVTESAGAQASNAPTLQIAGGTATADGFRFVNRGYSYVLSQHGPGAATLTVSAGGRTVQTERLTGYQALARPARSAMLGPDAVWDGQGLDGCRRQDTPAALRACAVDRMRAAGVSDAGIAFTRAETGDFRFVSGWRQAGPVGIAQLSYPFRANTNSGTALVPAGGDPLIVDAYAPTAADRARPDYRAAMAAHADAWPVAPADVSAAKGAPGAAVTIRARTRLATCHACAGVGTMTVAYRFDPAGRFVFAGVERVDAPADLPPSSAGA